MQEKVLVLDIDGTLTNSKKEITEATKQGIWNILQHGHKVILASGRPTPGMRKCEEELELKKYGGYLLSFNGARIVECKTGEVELHGKWYDTDTYICDPLINKVDGKTLLLFFYSSTESTTNLNYQIVTYKDVSDVLESNRILFYQAGTLTLVLLLLTGTILFFSLRKIMAPLTKLREAAVSVSEGNYDIQVPAEGDTELAQVGKSFNQMSSKVKEQIECLSTVNHTQRQLMGSLANELKTPIVVKPPL